MYVVAVRRLHDNLTNDINGEPGHILGKSEKFPISSLFQQFPTEFGHSIDYFRHQCREMGIREAWVES